MEKSQLTILINGLNVLACGWVYVKKQMKCKTQMPFYGSFSFTKAHFLLDALAVFCAARVTALHSIAAPRLRDGTSNARQGSSDS